MIINYKITKIINESESKIDFKRGIVLKDVEFEAVSNYSESISVIETSVEIKHWKKAKKSMSITL